MYAELYCQFLYTKRMFSWEVRDYSLFSMIQVNILQFLSKLWNNFRSSPQALESSSLLLSFISSTSMTISSSWHQDYQVYSICFIRTWLSWFRYRSSGVQSSGQDWGIILWINWCWDWSWLVLCTNQSSDHEVYSARGDWEGRLHDMLLNK